MLLLLIGEINVSLLLIGEIKNIITVFTNANQKNINKNLFLNFILFFGQISVLQP